MLSSRARLTVLLAGFISLAQELIQVRMLAFFLGNNLDTLAIPLALLGLALGSLAYHLAPVDRSRWVGRLARGLLGVLIATFMAFFFAADAFFSHNHVAWAHPSHDSARLVVYVALFLPSYAMLGALLAALFARHAAHIGRLYFHDLVGAAAGCLLVPVALTVSGLPAALLLLFAAAWVLLWLHGTRVQAVAGGVLVILVGVLAAGQVTLRAHPDPAVLARSVLREGPHHVIHEARVRWNHIARTSLLKRRDTRKNTVSYAIVQDNGLSNVGVKPWVDEPGPLRGAFHHQLAWEVGLEPRRILVMFAGTGRDMMLLDRLAHGSATITGVELNPAVVDTVDLPQLEKLNLKSFFAQDHIELVNLEGRHFLDADTRTWDLIYVANNGAVHANRTGHTRKFLDTFEAMEAYLDRLAPGGMIVFVNQPVQSKIPAFKRLFDERGLEGFGRALYVFGRPDVPSLDSLLVKPDHFTRSDVETLDGLVDTLGHGIRTLHSFLDANAARRIHIRVRGPVDPAGLVTDDRPFTRGIAWRDWVALPGPKHVASPAFVADWIKIFTVLLFGGLAAIISVVTSRAGGPEARVPGPWAAYLLASGIGYMAVEIGLIAKSELLAGNPLYAVAVNLALYLISNAGGAWLHDTQPRLRHPAVLALGIVGGATWALIALGAATDHLVAMPLVVRVAAIAVAVAPAGVAAGLFYPYAVGCLLHTGHPRAVPATYALTTLSSVLGSAAAMVAILDLGFTMVIGLGAVAYVGAALLAGFTLLPDRSPRTTVHSP